jgi:alanyl-tRNA synthetase
VALNLPNASADDLRKITDIVRDKVKQCVVVAASPAAENKGLLVVAVSKEAQTQFNAGKVMRLISQQFGGKGGGGAAIAQGGIPSDKIKDLFKNIAHLLEN